MPPAPWGASTKRTAADGGFRRLRRSGSGVTTAAHSRDRGPRTADSGRTVPARVVLVGAGHTHIQVLRHWIMHPNPAVEATLVVDTPIAVYSGMAPGLVAGQYQRHELEIDAVPLARRAGVRVVLAPCVGVGGRGAAAPRLWSRTPALRPGVLRRGRHGGRTRPSRGPRARGSHAAHQPPGRGGRWSHRGPDCQTAEGGCRR